MGLFSTRQDTDVTVTNQNENFFAPNLTNNVIVEGLDVLGGAVRDFLGASRTSNLGSRASVDQAGLNVASAIDGAGVNISGSISTGLGGLSNSLLSGSSNLAFGIVAGGAIIGAAVVLS